MSRVLRATGCKNEYLSANVCNNSRSLFSGLQVSWRVLSDYLVTRGVGGVDSVTVRLLYRIVSYSLDTQYEVANRWSARVRHPVVHHDQSGGRHEAAHSRTGPILIEDAANGPAIFNALSRLVPGIIAVKPEGGVARARAAQPLVEAGGCRIRGRIGGLVPERAWAQGFLHQRAVFPTGEHDDDVDAFTQLVARWLQPQPEYRISVF
jgi:hypothetical protein